MNPLHTLETRITELEIKLSFTEDTVEQLNAVVVRQQAQIDRLVRELGARPGERIAALSLERGSSPVIVTLDRSSDRAQRLLFLDPPTGQVLASGGSGQVAFFGRAHKQAQVGQIEFHGGDLSWKS